MISTPFDNWTFAWAYLSFLSAFQMTLLRDSMVLVIYIFTYVLRIIEDSIQAQAMCSYWFTHNFYHYFMENLFGFMAIYTFMLCVIISR